MNDTIQKMIDHPFKTAVVISSVANALANIIVAFRGVPSNPIINIVKEVAK